MTTLVELAFGSLWVGGFAVQTEQVVKPWPDHLLAIGLPYADLRISPCRSRVRVSRL
jgi:hypothetical protein